MTAKNCSLAVDEVMESPLFLRKEEGYEPELKVLINERYKSHPTADNTGGPVKISGRITVSF